MKHRILDDNTKHEIKEKYKNTRTSQSELAEKYMVSIRTIHNIIKNEPKQKAIDKMDSEEPLEKKKKKKAIRITNLAEYIGL